MVVFLVTVIVLLMGVIVFLNIQFYREKRQFRAKIESMHIFIAEITRRQSGQRHKVQLSDALNEKLKSDNAVLSREIFTLNYELFDLLSKNNGLQK
ncbi:hypothetical protein [Flavobacterium sp.]|uniref:hypothetical protein n=1 Tax=Flavobacterium sp. TaxID=239 RepID=UPI0039E43A09